MNNNEECRKELQAVIDKYNITFEVAFDWGGEHIFALCDGNKIAELYTNEV